MPHLENVDSNLQKGKHAKENAAIKFTHQAEYLGQYKHSQEDEKTGSTQAAEAKFITPLDPVVETIKGGRLPVIPVDEAVKLNRLKEQTEEAQSANLSTDVEHRGEDGAVTPEPRQSERTDASLRKAIPPSKTHPLFPPLPMYGPPTLLRSIQCFVFRMTSAVLSLCFLLAIVTGAILNSIPRTLRNARIRAKLQSPKKQRPFYEEEKKRRQERRAAQKAWLKQQRGNGMQTPSDEKGSNVPQDRKFVHTEGGPDPLRLDVGYYARRVGLDSETFEVQTEDGFVIELWHIFNPREYKQPPAPNREIDGPNILKTTPNGPRFGEAQPSLAAEKRYPVLMMHGLLQNAGAFCCNDDDSLAFYLAKSGYDVWLGNNRCGFHPKHTMLDYRDPRMWAWNIRQMGVLDLPALVSRVLAETGFPKLALIAHSQGTTETFVALAKEQRPDLGEKISVFCALAPAAYAGPLIGRLYFKVMRLVSPGTYIVVNNRFGTSMLPPHVVSSVRAWY